MENQPIQHKTPYLLIASVSLATVSVVVTIAYLLGFFNQNTSPTALKQSAQVQEVRDLKIKGNKNSKIYHLRGCPNYDDIADHNIVWFKTKEEAKAAGFRMARNC